MTTEDLASIIREYTGTVVADLKAEIVSLRAELQRKSAVPDLESLIRDAVAASVSALPVPKDGKDGLDGKDGTNGKDADPILVSDLEPLIRDSVTAAVGAWPVPKDGHDGLDGKDGRDGKDAEPAQPGAKGDPGEKGEPGRDGLSVKDALIDRDGHLVLCLSDGTTKALGVVVGEPGAAGATGAKGENGQDGINGVNGKDGTLEQLKVVRIDERTIEFQFKDGRPIEGGRIVLNHPVFQNTYRGDVTYKAGDLVQWGGSGYIAMVDAPQMKPGSGAPDLTGWKLWIKGGVDGKDGKPGEKGLDGKPGKDGKDRW